MPLVYRLRIYFRCRRQGVLCNPESRFQLSKMACAVEDSQASPCPVPSPLAEVPSPHHKAHSPGAFRPCLPSSQHTDVYILGPICQQREKGSTASSSKNGIHHAAAHAHCSTDTAHLSASLRYLLLLGTGGTEVPVQLWACGEWGWGLYAAFPCIPGK